MGDSACLMQPFCYASGITNEANESNPIQALGQSISFGRFVSESLAWEKWSSFSHNRYVEEAERYAKPGSVAQKKAFFEAHYKKLAAQKAAALLEQANNAAAATSNTTEEEDGGEVVDSTSPNSKMVVKEEQDAKVLALNSEEPGPMLRANVHDSDSNVKAINNIPETEGNNVEGAEQDMEQEDLIGNSLKVELQSQLEDVDNHKEQSEKLSGTRTPQIMTPTLKQGSNYDLEVLASMGKKKPPVSSFQLLKATGTSKFTSTPVKSTAPISSKRDNIATPMSNKPSADKRRSTPKSLQMSVNFTPIRELNRLTASVIRRFESTRVGAGSSSKASKDSLTPLRTPTMASKKDMQKHSSLTPLTEKKRNKTPIADSSVSGNHTGGSKWRLLSSENKIRSPIISSPFSLRTEERAARRKKKLEEKFNANEGQKVQLHTKLKERAETEIRKLSQSFCFKARPLPDFYKERKASKNETKMDPLTHSESSKEGRKTTPRPSSVVESQTSLPPNRPSLKNNVTKNFQGKSVGTSIHPLTSYSRMITTHENASPNVQHGNQNDRNYKK